MINSLSSMSRVADLYKKTLDVSLDKPESKTGENQKSFSDVIMKTLNSVDESNKNADRAVTDLATGKNVDIHNAMIAIEKADISFQFMMQVRNKLVSAYQEINRMQV